MYKILDKTTRNWVLFVLFGTSLALNALMIWPESLSELMRAIYTTPATFGLLTLVLGKTSLWRRLWTRFPILSSWIFPDLNGTWTTTMESNIRAMAKHHPDFADIDLDSIKATIPGKFTIKQDWFRLSIRFDSDDRYSKSNTLIVEPCKDAENQQFFLTYVYKNETVDPKPTDEQFHFGAANLEVDASFDEMRGTYWTNRNAPKGLNTAGSLVAVRESRNGAEDKSRDQAAIEDSRSLEMRENTPNAKKVP